MDEQMGDFEESPEKQNNLLHDIQESLDREWEKNEVVFSPYKGGEVDIELRMEMEGYADQGKRIRVITPQAIRAKEDNEGAKLMDFDGEISLLEQSVAEIIPIMDFNEACFTPIQPKVFQPKTEDCISTTRQQEQNSKVLNESQTTVLINSQSFNSKITEQKSTCQDTTNSASCLRQFLILNQKNYRPHICQLKGLYSFLRNHSIKTLRNIKMYLNFLEVKMKQEIEALKRMDQHQGQAIRSSKEIDIVYVDEKLAIGQFKDVIQQRRKDVGFFYKEILRTYEKLSVVYRRIKQKRQKRQRQIEESIIKPIDQIEFEMEEVIRCRLKLEKQPKKSLDSSLPYVSRDKYLEFRYLMQRQKMYYRLIGNFHQKIITYLIHVVDKEQTNIIKTFNECLISYSKAYLDCYDPNNQAILDILTSHPDDTQTLQSLKGQLCTLLLGNLPNELYDYQPNNMVGNDRLQWVISDLNCQLQNVMFMPTIQMNMEYIFFKSEAVWKPAPDIQANFAISDALKAPNTKPQKENEPSGPTKLLVVLTSNYFLHLQNDDKIASLKLNDVKLSKKGRQVIITGKGKGLTSYFLPQKQLGRLGFESYDQVDIFTQKVTQMMKKT